MIVSSTPSGRTSGSATAKDQSRVKYKVNFVICSRRLDLSLF